MPLARRPLFGLDLPQGGPDLPPDGPDLPPGDLNRSCPNHRLNRPADITSVTICIDSNERSPTVGRRGRPTR